MKIQYKIMLFLISATVLFYSFLPNKSQSYPVGSYSEKAIIFIDLKIYQNESFYQYYDFKLVCDSNEKFLYREFDSLKNSYYLTTYDIIPGKYEIQIISRFDSIIKFNIDLQKDTSFKLDTNWIKKYDKQDEYYTYFKKRINNNLPFDLVFESRGCFYNSNIRYVFNLNLENLSMIYQIKNGVITDSMQIEKSTLNKKLHKILRNYKNPDKPKSYVNKDGETILTIEKTISTSSTTLYFNHEEKLYSIWSNDLVGKGYDYFQEFSNSFENPLFQMKL